MSVAQIRAGRRKIRLQYRGGSRRGVAEAIAVARREAARANELRARLAKRAQAK